jgi:hypothetical protein
LTLSRGQIQCGVCFALADGPVQRFAGLRIAVIGELPVAVDDVVATPLQFFGHRGLAGAGDAFDQVVSNAHCTPFRDTPLGLKAQQRDALSWQ